MHISKVSPKQITTKRLDSDFYSPVYLENEKLLERHSLKELSSIGKFFAGPFGSKLPSNLYLDKGVPLFRVSNVGQFEVDWNGMAYLSPEVHKELVSSEVIAGDLLIVKASVGEKICLVPADIKKANITQHIIGIRPNDSVDINYISTFLFSKYGRRQLERYSLGSLIQYLGIVDARSVKFVDLNHLTQKYIGAKVRHAEQLRAWALAVEREITEFHSQFIPEQNGLDFDKKTRRVSTFQMTDRFDAHFYPAVVEDYLKRSTNSFEKIFKVCSAVYNGQTNNETESKVNVEQITVANLSPSFVKGQPRKVLKPNSGEKLTKVHDLLMCNAAHNKSYIGRDITYVHNDKQLLPSTEVMVIRLDRNQLPASYVRSYLLSKVGYVQIQSTIRGITAHSYPVDMNLLDIPVPEIPDSLKEQWFESDQKMALAGQAVEYATLLTNAAKSLVERLIEGSITEQQLIDAQQALISDDNSLDREILSQLTDTGFNEGGKAVFSDLDQLYDLLAQSKDYLETEA